MGVVHCSVHMIMCAPLFFLVFRVMFPLSLLKTWYILHTFHKRQNNGCEKRSRDELYFSIPLQLRANFRLLINTDFSGEPIWFVIVITAGYNEYVSLLRRCTCAIVLTGWDKTHSLTECVRSICEFLGCLHASLSEGEDVHVYIPAVQLQINSELAIYNIPLSHCLCHLAWRFMYFVF